MSVVIKGMKMPESCSRCLLMVGTFCDVLETDVDPFYDGANKRHASCPLVGLPEKHGRLIEEPEYFNYGGLATISKYDFRSIAEYFAMQVKAQPTIIEAEGDEE